MSVDKHVFIMPLQTMTRKSFEKYLKDQYDFLDYDFVLRNALQLWIDYLLDPDGEWYTNVEEEIHLNYGKNISAMAGRMVFRDGKQSNEVRDRRLGYKGQLVDTMVAEIGKHISAVSDYLSNRLDEEDIEDLVMDSEYEVLVQAAWITGRSVKFVVEEV